jgi:two-component system, cell cycle response regulator
VSLFSRERLAQLQEVSVQPDHSVLIVDDEEANLRVLRMMLAPRFRVLEAADGEAALAVLRDLPAEQAPCLVLSDQRMPRMTGVELFEQLREQLPDSIRIIITGFVDVAAIVDAINRAGIYKFVVKPFDRNDLLLTVDRAFEAWRLRRQVAEHIRDLEDKVRARTAELEAKAEALQQALQAIERASLTDALTGLGNRRLLRREMESRGNDRRRSGGGREGLLIVDLDHFKSINDDYGHAAGDAVLEQMGALLRAHCREHDLAVRWGGEEFLLRVAVADETEALACAERLRCAVADTDFQLPDGRVLRRTCSIGVACLPFAPSQPAALDWEGVLAIADAALYRAKRGGRNAAVALRAASTLPGDVLARIHHDLPRLLDDAVLLEHRTPP